MFISRTELLPEEETVEEHQQARESETAVTKSDETGQGLFKGMFRTQGRRGLANVDIPGERGGAIRDFGDGVLRCPECLWELEHGECGRCGFHTQDFAEGPDFSADDFSDEDVDSELDHEFDDEDVIEYAVDGRIIGTVGPIIRDGTPYADTDVGTEYTVNSTQDSPGHSVANVRGSGSSQTSSDDDSDSEEDDGYDEEMHGFLVDEHEEQDGSDTSSNTSEESTRTEQPHFYGIELEMGTGIGSDSDSSTRSSQHSTTTRSTNQSDATSTTDGSDGEEPESDDATPTPEIRPFQRRGGGRIIHDDDDDVRAVETVDLTRLSTTPPRSREERNAHLNSRRSARDRRNQGNNNFDADFPSIQDPADDDDEPIRSTRRPSGRGRSRPATDDAWRDMRRDGPAARYPVRVA